MDILGFPLWGFWLPFVGRRTVPLNADGSVVDTGLADITDEVGPYYSRPVVFEWFGVGVPLAPSYVYRTGVEGPVVPPWEVEPDAPGDVPHVPR